MLICFVPVFGFATINKFDFIFGFVSVKKWDIKKNEV